MKNVSEVDPAEYSNKEVSKLVESEEFKAYQKKKEELGGSQKNEGEENKEPER